MKASYIYGAEEAIKNLYVLDYKLFVSSATPISELSKIINKMNISRYFDEVFGTPESKYNHVQKILRDCKCSPSEILYVGDSEIDRKTALLAGCHFLGIGSNYKRFRVKPSRMESSLNNLISIIVNMEK